MDKPRPKVVVSGLIKRDDKYLLVKEIIEDGKEHWLVPGGKVDFGESLHQALQREIKEELGLEIEIDGKAYLNYHEAIFPELDYHTIIFFFQINSTRGHITLEDKLLEAKFFSLAEMEELPLVSSAQWLVNELKKKK